MDTSSTLVIPFTLMVVPHMRLRTDGRILSVCSDFGIVSLCLVDSVDSFKRDHVLRFSFKLFFNNLTLFYCVLSFNLFLRLIIAINLITQRIVTTFRKKRMPINVFLLEHYSYCNISSLYCSCFCWCSTISLCQILDIC